MKIPSFAAIEDKVGEPIEQACPHSSHGDNMDERTRARLWNYFEARQGPLWHAFVDSQENLAKQTDELAQLANTITDSERGRRFHHYLRVDNALQYGHLIAACSLLEHSVKFICGAIDPHYEAKQVEKKYQGRGNWLEKHLLHLEDNKLVSPNAELANTATELSYAITLRNCIGHAWGNLDADQYRDEARAAIKHLEANEANCNYACESKDGHLLIGDDLVPHVFSLGEQLIRMLLRMD